MASHLTIVGGPTAGFASRSLNGQSPSNGQGGAEDFFGALLGGATSGDRSAGATDKSSQTTVERLTAWAESGESTGRNADGSDILAAGLDLQPAAQAVAQPGPVVELVDAFAALRARLDAGEAPGDELIQRVEQALEALAEALGLSLDDLSVPGDFAALLDNASEDGLAGTIVQLLTPLAEPLTSSAANDASLDEQVRVLSDKLAALLGALDGDTVSDEALAALGSPRGGQSDAQIEAALARFASAQAEVPTKPELATPSLKLSETALGGKPSETTVQAQGAASTDIDGGGAGSTNDKSSNANGASANRENAPLSRDSGAPVAPASVDASGAPSPSATPAPGESAIRLDAAANSRIVQTGYQTSQQQLNLPQIAFEMARQVTDGNTRFQIRLDPPELGRIDVRLDIDQSGQVRARLTVEKAETLDLMQRDQRALERALQQAGLDSGKTNLEFSLKQNPFAGQQDRQTRDEAIADFSDGDLITDEPAEPAPTVNLYRGALQASGLNIFA